MDFTLHKCLTIVLTELCHLHLPQGHMGITVAQHCCLHRLQSRFLFLSLVPLSVWVLVLCFVAGFPPTPPNSNKDVATCCGFDLCFPKWLMMWSNSHTYSFPCFVTFLLLSLKSSLYIMDTNDLSELCCVTVSPEIETFHPTGKLFKQGDKITSK